MNDYFQEPYGKQHASNKWAYIMISPYGVIGFEDKEDADKAYAGILAVNPLAAQQIRRLKIELHPKGTDFKNKAFNDMMKHTGRSN